MFPARVVALCEDARAGIATMSPTVHDVHVGGDDDWPVARGDAYGAELTGRPVGGPGGALLR